MPRRPALPPVFRETRGGLLLAAILSAVMTVSTSTGAAGSVALPRSGGPALRDALNADHAKPAPNIARTAPSAVAGTAAPGGPTLAPPSQRSATPLRSSHPSLAWGVVEEGSGGLASVESLVNRRANLLQSYIHWGGGWADYSQIAPSIHAALDHGSVPVITWLSDDPTVADQSGYAPRRIAAGAFDAYVHSWAVGLGSLGSTVLLRFDPEMNGDWTGYSPGVGGTTAADYVAAWRHIHDVFAAAGAGNVRWVWSPNVEYNGSTSLLSLYPGDSYVDWAALDGYNWGDTHGKVWQSFSDVFDQSIADIRTVTTRPLMLAEVGSSPVGGDKAAWIADMFAQLGRHPEIRAFIWFDLNKETDWRIQSSAASAAAFAAGLATTVGFTGF